MSQSCSPCSRDTANPGLCSVCCLAGRHQLLAVFSAAPVLPCRGVCSKLGSFLAEMLQGIMIKSGDLNTSLKQFKALATLCSLSAGPWYLNKQIFFSENITLTNRFPFIFSDLRLFYLMLFPCGFLQFGFTKSPEDSRMSKKTI